MVFTDNVLALLAVACQFVTATGTKKTVLNSMTDINGVSFTVNGYTGNTALGMNVSAVQSYAQIGKSNTPPTRQDFAVANPFTNGGGAEEDNLVISLLAVYVSATEKIQMSTSLTAGGSGDIQEVCKFVTINDDTGVDRIIMISRDVIPPVNFIAGQIINITNEVLT